jgi:N-acetylglutamate synthase-like GNAT family acetyltransferase
VINQAIQGMDGLNAAARALVLSKNEPAALAADLCRCFALVVEGVGGVEAVGALDGVEIRRLYVQPGAQRRGTGSLLVGELEAEARRRGIERLEVHASPSSEGFYRARGFQRIGEQTTRNGPAEFRHVHMVKDLHV